MRLRILLLRRIKNEAIEFDYNLHNLYTGSRKALDCANNQNNNINAIGGQIMKFKALLLHMAATEIKAMIPPYYFDDIKRRDPKPLFKAFVVGQEGKAEAKWVGVGNIVKTWFADAIGKMTRMIWPGLKLFHGHEETNETEGRQEVGEVAGSRAQTIDNKYSAVIAAYIYPEFKNLPLNIASVEVEVESQDIDGDIKAVNVKDVTAIALGNSAINKPGFPGATLLGELQAFAKGTESNKEVIMTLDEIKEFIKNEGLDPSEVFKQEQLLDDPIIKGYIKGEVKETKGNEYSARQRNLAEYEEKTNKLEADKKKLEDENKKLKTEGAKVQATDLFGKKAKERKLDEKQTKFIDMKKTSFVPEDLENVDKEVDKFMDTALEDYKKTASEIFGIEEKKETDLTPGGEPDETGVENVDLLPT